jgi:hypothetical protein
MKLIKKLIDVSWFVGYRLKTDSDALVIYYWSKLQLTVAARYKHVLSSLA